MNKRYRGLLAIAVFFGVSCACAADFDDVRQLMNARQYGPALQKIDEYLSRQPGEPRLRFYKGVIETDTGKITEAIETFSRLTQDYPALAQPYNNLGVLYAAQRQYDKAKVTLETAIRVDASYPTTHENLGDMYVRLAARSYLQAMAKGGPDARSMIEPKLKALDTVLGPETGGPLPSPARTGATGSRQASGYITPPPTPAPAQSVQSASRDSQIAADAGSDEVRDTVRDWAAAWSSQNIDAYLAFYARDFVPANRQSRQAWEVERKARIGGKAQISVKLSNVSVSVDGARANVQFLQQYTGGGLDVSSKKRLQLARAGNRWLIVRELSSN